MAIITVHKLESVVINSETHISIQTGDSFASARDIKFKIENILNQLKLSVGTARTTHFEIECAGL